MSGTLTSRRLLLLYAILRQGVPVFGVARGHSVRSSGMENLALVTGELLGIGMEAERLSFCPCLPRLLYIQDIVRLTYLVSQLNGVVNNRRTKADIS